MFHSYSVTGTTECKCYDWSEKIGHAKQIKLTCKASKDMTIKLVQYSEKSPRLIEGYFDGYCMDTQVGFRELPAKLVHVNTDEDILVRECSTCVSALVEKDLFNVPDGMTVYWCELLDEGQPEGAGSLVGNCWEICTSFVSGHLQPRIQMAMDIYKNTRVCPFEHQLATRICADEKSHFCSYVEPYVDHSCAGHKRYSQVAVALYVMSCFYAHDYDISDLIDGMENTFCLYESTNVNAFYEMTSAGAGSNDSPWLRFLKIARDLLTSEELKQCEDVAARYWRWKRMENKRHRDKIVKRANSEEEEEEEAEEIEPRSVATPYTPSEFKLALVRALYTCEYLAMAGQDASCFDEILSVCRRATEKLPELHLLESGRSTFMFDYDFDEMRRSDAFIALRKAQDVTRKQGTRLKTDRAKTQIAYTKIFFTDSPGIMRLPGYILNGLHQPMVRFNEFHLAEDEVGHKKKKKKKKKDG
jgi:hypothetical protein